MNNFLVLIGLIFTIFLMLFFAILWYYSTKRYIELKKRYSLDIAKAREDAIKRSRASLEGKIYEQLVTYFPEWKYTPSDARFIASPLDFIVFDGLSEGEPKQIILVEVKKGSSSKSVIQNKIKKIIEEGKVSFETIKLG